MTTFQATRNVAGAAALFLALAAAANVTFAAEKPVGTYGQLRTVLAFKVPDATAQKLLPQGWSASPPSTGPSKDAKSECRVGRSAHGAESGRIAGRNV